MLQFDSLLLDAFYNETRDFFCGARIQKIQQPTRRDIILHLRNQGESRKFYINIHPLFYHVCFMKKGNEYKRDIEIPKHPPMFCMLLRKHMEGARILCINKPANERILELIFENYNELGDRIEECLSIELMGKHSNVVLYNTDNNIILGCAHNVGAEKSKERELAGGLPYIYPPKQNKRNLHLTKFDSFKSSVLNSDDTIKKTISDKYFNFPQVVVEDLCEMNQINANHLSGNLLEQELQLLFIALQEFIANKEHNYFVNDDFSKYSCVKNIGTMYSGINSLIDDYFTYNIEQELLKNTKTSLKNKIEKDLKKQLNAYKNQQKQIDKKDLSFLYKKKGNLLISNAYSIKSGVSLVTLFDYETQSDIEIELDENLSPVENANKYFALYSKTKKTWQVSEEMAQKTIEEIEYLNHLVYYIDICQSLDELKEIVLEFDLRQDVSKFGLESAERSSDNRLSSVKKKKLENTIVEKISVNGFDVYVGKNNKQNDYLYSKVSSPADMWFHALNTPGSHVILKQNDSKKELDNDTILQVAKLAKQYSSAKDSTKVPVVYTLRKYIKRPNNTKSGFVVYKNESEIVVD